MKHYGVSPWEINVITSILDKRFLTEDEEIENTYEEKFVSHLEILFPYSFNDEFFKWFDYKEWDRLKGVFKEMKRRRGDGKALRIELSFSGEPNIKFVIESDQSQWFKMEVEKIDFVVELLPYHLDEEKLPMGVNSVIYNFDQEAARWRLNTVFTDEKKFVNTEKGWKLTT